MGYTEAGIRRVENLVRTLKKRNDELEAQLQQAREELAEARRLAQWTPITPENLPKVGDEVLSVGEEGEAYLMAPWSDKDSFADLSRDGWTHYRPITPPEVKP